MPGAHAKGLIRIGGIHKQQGRFPNAEEAAEISIDLDFSNNYSLLLEPDSGKIFISFQAGDAKRIELTPRVKVNKIDWLCKTNLKRSVLPNDTQQSLNWSLWLNAKTHITLRFAKQTAKGDKWLINEADIDFY